jgi:ATP-dependent helicase/nuclease subunit B
MAGPVSAMRCQQVKHVIVLGALEGQLPGYSGAMGVLSDQERLAIRHLGIPLTGGAIEGVHAEFAAIYGVFCGAESTVSVFCPPGQPSYLFRRLLALRGDASDISTTFTVARADTTEAAAYLSSIDAYDTAFDLNLSNEYEIAKDHKYHELGKVTRDQITALYGNSLYLSASQVDKLADCRFAYFLKYGLRLKERKTITIDPAEFGTFVHAVLENTAKEVMQLGGFRQIDLDTTLKISDKYAKDYVESRFQQLDSSRISYLLERNAAELRLIVKDLWEELANAEFEPIGFEVAFGDYADLDAISISGREMPARLRGFVDRVDLWRNANQNFYRVVDYKTGRKDFDYCDVFNGYGLQMLLYLFALEDKGEKLLGHRPIASGVQYFPARVPIVSADGIMSDEESALVREKSMKRKGLLLRDEMILQAMEPGEKPKRLNYTRRKDGSIEGDLATNAQMRMLKAYVFTLLGKLVDDIASGCIEANPYTRGTSHNACQYCPFGTVCHSQYVEGRRNYKSMSAQRFWDEVEKEMSKHG